MEILCHILCYSSQLELDVLKPQLWVVMPEVQQLDCSSTDSIDVGCAANTGQSGSYIISTIVVQPNNILLTSGSPNVVSIEGRDEKQSCVELVLLSTSN